MFGYYNVVDPDLNKPEARRGQDPGIALEREPAGLPRGLDGDGHFSSQSEWESDPENQTEQGYLQCKSVFEKHARLAEKHGTMLAIEGYYRNIIGTIDRAERLFREVGFSGLAAGDGSVQLLSQGRPAANAADAGDRCSRDWVSTS